MSFKKSRISDFWLIWRNKIADKLLQIVHVLSDTPCVAKFYFNNTQYDYLNFINILKRLFKNKLAALIWEKLN